jgi:phospholipid transport system substrate-binding protein
MKKDPDGWRVWDVITDEVSLVKNYRTQLNKIITEQSYDALIKKMKSKLKDGE